MLDLPRFCALCLFGVSCDVTSPVTIIVMWYRGWQKGRIITLWNVNVLQSMVPSLWCESLFWNSATSLILRCSFHSHRWFFDKVKITNFKRLGNSTGSKGFHPLVSSFSNHQTGHSRVILVHMIKNDVNVYQQETSQLVKKYAVCSLQMSYIAHQS
jgi:hypothetical protein